MICPQEMKPNKRIGYFALAIIFILFAISFFLPEKPLIDGTEQAWVQMAAMAIGAIMSAVQAAQAAKAAKEANRRPTWQIPQAQKEALEIQKRLASMDKAPGYDTAVNQASQAAAKSMLGVKQASGGNPASMGAITDIYAKTLDNQNKLDIQNQQFKVGQQQNLAGALNQYGNLQNEEWVYNVGKPYDVAVANKNALQNAAISNAFATANMAAQYGEARDYNKLVKDIYGGGNNKNTTQTNNNGFANLNLPKNVPLNIPPSSSTPSLMNSEFMKDPKMMKAFMDAYGNSQGGGMGGDYSTPSFPFAPEQNIFSGG